MDDPRLHELLRGLVTESRNPRTSHIDTVDTLGILRMLHAEDRSVLDVVADVLPVWGQVVEEVATRFGQGGRLFYVGAGTSGRLGVLDAAECPPTYGTDPDRVVGLVAGGHETLVRSQEGVEDRGQDGAAEVEAHGLGPGDALVGISASRRTPYVVAALRRARERGAWTCLLSCNPLDEPTRALADVVVEAVTGPEAITGSTRMKAALAQKMLLTMLSTAVMVRTGKVYGNLMVDVAPTSQKLRERAKGLVMDLGGVDYAQAARLLESSDDDVKVAIVRARAGVTPEEARRRLASSQGRLAAVLGPLGASGEEER